MKISINKKVFSRFHSKFKVAFILVKNIDNNSKLRESLHLLEEAEQLIRLSFNKETVKNHHLMAPWSVAQEEFGKEARHYHTSVERLVKRVIARKSVATKNTLTNILCYLALKHIIPFGVDDYDEVEGDLEYNLASGREKLGILRTIEPDALYYRDDKSILGTKLDYWKSKRTMLSPNTKNALVHFDVLPPLNKKSLDLLIKEANSLISTFCSGKTKVFLLDEKKRMIKL